MIEDRSARAQAGVAFLSYLGVSIVLYGLPVLTHLSGRFVGEGSGDARLYVWDLAWWPHAIASGLNPFHPTVVWAPTGANMAWITGLPGPALAMAPITAIFGGVVASNLLAIVAPALNGWAAFLLCRELTDRFWPSLAGAYLFAFSTYEVGQMHGHMDLFLVFPVPLAVYLVVRFVKGGITRRRLVWWLGATLVAQFSISTEVFATMTFFGAIAMAGALAFVPVVRERSRDLLLAIGAAYGLAAIPLAPYLWYATSGVPPVLANGIGGSSADLLGFLLPRTGTLIGGSAFAGVMRSLNSNVSEDGAYLTPTLLIAVTIAGVTMRRDPVVRFSLALIAIAGLLALGARLEVGGHRTVLLPWDVFERIPVLKDAIPERFTMYVWLGIAVVVARWLARIPPPRLLTGALAWGLIGLSAILLLPNVSLPHLHQPIEVPAFFGDGAYRRYLSPGETILILHSAAHEGDEMLFQELTGFAFAMPQGHTGPAPAAFASDPVWQDLSGGQPYGVTAGELRTWLRAHGVGALVVEPDVAPRWRSLLSAASGSHPTPADGMVVYQMRG